MLTPRQLEVLRFNESDDRFLLADGPIRCGKTFPTSIGFAQWVVDRPHHSHALLGYTADTAFRNVVPNLLDTWDYIGVPHRMIRGAAARLVVNEQTEVYVMGAGTILGENRLRGLELVGLYCDELATYPKDVYEMAMGRLSVPGAKAWGTCNPGPARHWVKTEIIDANMCRRGRAVAAVPRVQPVAHAGVHRRCREALHGAHPPAADSRRVVRRYGADLPDVA